MITGIVASLGPFSPVTLFANGEQGVWYDPSDLSTLFQDSAGTTPVTADSQPVGLALDKSGNGNHASQATATARPLYRTDGTRHWLEFDGVDIGDLSITQHSDSRSKLGDQFIRFKDQSLFDAAQGNLNQTPVTIRSHIRVKRTAYRTS